MSQNHSSRVIRSLLGGCGGLFGSVIGLHVWRLHDIAWQIAWGFQLAPWSRYREVVAEFIVRAAAGIAMGCWVGFGTKGQPRCAFWTGLIASSAVNLVMPGLF